MLRSSRDFGVGIQADHLNIASGSSVDNTTSVEPNEEQFRILRTEGGPGKIYLRQRGFAVSSLNPRTSHGILLEPRGRVETRRIEHY